MTTDAPSTPQKLRQSRPAPSEQLEELDATYAIALQRCQNAKDVYDARCKVSRGLEVDCTGSEISPVAQPTSKRWVDECMWGRHENQCPCRFTAEAHPHKAAKASTECVYDIIT